MNQEDQTNVAVQSAGEPTPQTSSPPVEAPATAEQTTQVAADQPQQEQVEPEVEADESKDPREFQIKRLAEENRRLKAEKRGSAFDAFRPQVQPAIGQVDPNQFTNQFGETDWQRYNAAVIASAQQAATAQAQQTAQEMFDEQNARTKHPELFADPETEQEIADRWIAAKIRGENPSVSDIADRVAKRFSKDVTKAEKRGAEKALQEVSVKEQAGLSVAGQTAQASREAQSERDLEELSAQTRVGNQDAIVARLRNIPWANK